MNTPNVALAQMIGALLALYEIGLAESRPGFNVGKLIGDVLRRPVLIGKLGALFIGECSALRQGNPALLASIDAEVFAVSEHVSVDGILPGFASPELISLTLVAYNQARARIASTSGGQKG
jgi:hypothetical protein